MIDADRAGEEMGNNDHCRQSRRGETGNNDHHM
jgi:hypothetical protein